MSNIAKQLGKKKIVIGAVHLSPSPGYIGYDSVEKSIKRAQLDLNALIRGGVDAVIFENNYDLPHRVAVGPETVAFMTHVISSMNFKKKIPIGISVLWNDFQSALSIAKVVGAEFIRVPAFVDTVKTSYGIVTAVGNKVKTFRKQIGGENIAIFADVQVKHSEMVNKRKTLKASIVQAQRKGADAIIITGKWTGDSPSLERIKTASEAATLPVIVGSGANSGNIASLFSIADAVIVSTSLKVGKLSKKEVNPNLKSNSQRISEKKTREFMSHVDRIKIG